MPFSAYPFMISICCMMGFLRNPKTFLRVLKSVIELTIYIFILFSSGYQPLDSAIKSVASSVADSSELEAPALSGDSTLLFNGRLFCFSGSNHIVGSFINVQLLFIMLADLQLLHYSLEPLRFSNGA